MEYIDFIYLFIVVFFSFSFLQKSVYNTTFSKHSHPDSTSITHFFQNTSNKKTKHRCLSPFVAKGYSVPSSRLILSLNKRPLSSDHHFERPSGHEFCFATVTSFAFTYFISCWWKVINLRQLKFVPLQKPLSILVNLGCLIFALFCFFGA